MNNKKALSNVLKISSRNHLSQTYQILSSIQRKKRKLETIEEKTPEQTQDFEETLTEELPIDAEAAESSGEESGEFIDEAIVREEIQKWLEENGSAFFMLNQQNF